MAAITSEQVNNMQNILIGSKSIRIPIKIFKEDWRMKIVAKIFDIS